MRNIHIRGRKGKKHNTHGNEAEEKPVISHESKRAGEYTELSYGTKKPDGRKLDPVIEGRLNAYIKKDRHDRVESFRSENSLPVDLIARRYEACGKINNKATPDLYKAVSFLESQGEIGKDLISAMNRLKAKQDSWNPFNRWNNEKKLDAIVNAILEIREEVKRTKSVTNGNEVEAYIGKNDSKLYKALNSKRFFESEGESKTLEISTASYKAKFKTIKEQDPMNQAPEAEDDATHRPN